MEVIQTRTSSAEVEEHEHFGSFGWVLDSDLSGEMQSNGRLRKQIFY